MKHLSDDFSIMYNRAINWDYWREHMGKLIDAGVVECIFAEDQDDILGFFIYTLFPDLLTGELTATEMYWYAKKNSSMAGIKIFNKFIDRAKEKKAVHINVTHLFDDPEVGRFLSKKGFKPIETHYSFKVVY